MDQYEGYAEFVSAHTPALSRVAYLLAGNHAAAQDLLQSALTKAAVRWRKISTSPAGYVRRVMYHESVSLWRRRRVIAEYATAKPPDTASATDEADHTVRRLVLQRALARLTPKQRAVLVLRFFEDYSVADAAELLGCSTGAVKSQTNYALRRLRELAPELGDLVAERPGSVPVEEGR
ncbi:MAG: SigE family RNA polymerase sigma factor [Micromonosporaceae bacterium]